jgi:hypothetical protein
MFRIFVLAALSQLLSIVCPAQQQKVKVLLLGTFHFDNPGLDVAKFENANIMSAQRQKEVLEVVKLLKQFGPDKIFVEQPASSQAALDSSYNRFARGEAPLKASELDQLGYRLAKDLGLDKLHAVDYREADFPFDSLMKSATAAKQFQLLGYVKQTIDSIEAAFNASLKTQTVKQLLLNQNSKEVKEFQVGTYFDFLVTGKEGDHVGSYLTSEWWRRNMVIYENILKRLDGKEKTILVIFGSGHTALLEAMMKYNRNIELVPVGSVLK